MDNAEKLKRIIERAIRQGFSILYPTIELAQTNWETIKYGEKIEIEISNEGFTTSHDLNTIIFDPDFAKAYWGEKLLSSCCKEEIRKDKYGLHCSKCLEMIDDDNKSIGIAWQYHLQQLALAEDRIEYLYKFITG